MLLDEPHAHLDPEASALVEPLIGPAAGRTRVGRHARLPRRRLGGARSASLGARRTGGTVAYEGPRRASSRASPSARSRSTRGAQRDEQRVRRHPRQGPARRAAHAAVGPRRWSCSRSRPSSSSASGSIAPRWRAASPPACCWRRCCSRRSSPINRLFVAEREQGGFDAIRLAPVDGTALFAAKVDGAGRLPARPRGWSRCPCSRSSSSTTGPRLPPLALVLVLADVGLAATGALVSSIATNSRARDLLVPLLLPAAARPADDRRRRRRRAAARRGGPRVRPGSATWLAVLGLYDVIFLLVGYAVFDFVLEDWRLRCHEASAHSRSPRSRPSSRRSPWCSSTPRSTPTRASSRRSSTSTCRWRSPRWSGSWSPRCTRSATCERTIRSTTPARTSRSTSR